MPPIKLEDIIRLKHQGRLGDCVACEKCGEIFASKALMLKHQDAVVTEGPGRQAAWI